MADRGQWRSNSGFVLAAIGSAVGLGNIWRFGYLCYDNGGGAFLIPYFIALFVVGVPLMILEFVLGHEKQASAPAATKKISPEWEWLGWWPVLFVMFGIVLYYNVIIARCFNYMGFSLSGLWQDLPWGADTEDFYLNKFLEITDGPWELGGLPLSALWSIVLVWVLNWLICYRHVEKGVELACRIFMPLLLVLTLILVGWSVFLPGAKQGLEVYLKPDWEILKHKKVWQDAFGQIFFTLSLGFGIMIAYASYLPRKVNLIRDALITCVSNCIFSFTAGLAVFSILGYMSKELGVAVKDVVTQGSGLAFVVYPKGMSLLGNTVGGIFGALFFLTLIVAGLSSSISIIEAFASAALDKFRISRGKLVTICAILGLGGSLIFCTRGGLYWMDIVDHFISSYGLMTVGLVECIVVGWIYEHGRMREHLAKTSEKPVNALVASWWDWSIKFAAPATMFLIILWSLRTELSEPYGGYTATANVIIGGGWLVVTHFTSVFFSHLRWKGKQ